MADKWKSYWEKKEFELVSHAMCMVEILDEIIEASEDNDPDLWIFFDMKAVANRCIDALEPEDEPEGGHPDNVISFKRYKATRR